MDTEQLCGALTKAGTPCRWTAPCSVHPGRAAGPVARAAARPARNSGRVPSELREIAHWVIRGVAGGTLDAPKAQAINGAARILVMLGEEPVKMDEAARGVALMGRLMHGIPPDTSEDWALAESIFEPAALEEFRRWPLLERDTFDGRDPLGLGDLGHDEGEVAGLADGEDAGLA